MYNICGEKYIFIIRFGKPNIVKKSKAQVVSEITHVNMKTMN